MVQVREQLPLRRVSPTKSPTGRNWREHKEDLKEDFHSHCGYCGSYDGFRHTYFEVDHFVPKYFFEKNGNIDYCHYPNLVYSCKFCNNNKLNKWPSQSESIFNLNGQGFIDPTDPEFDKHLYRSKDGSILWNTNLGKWMATVAFKFDERNYSIKLLWELNNLRIIVWEIADVLATLDEFTDKYLAIEEKAKNFSLTYIMYHRELMRFYDQK